MSQDKPKYDDLKAVFLNCTLKKSPDNSHTELLINASRNIMEKQGVKTELIRVTDYDIAFGMQPDMTKHGWEADEWPRIQEKVMAADIVVIGSPIWLGVKSSVATLAIERLYSNSGEKNDKGQYLYYGKTAGCIVTGNEDGVKAVASETLYAMAHIGFMIPPQPDAGWIGEAGPGPSFGDELEDGSRAGLDNDFTKKNTTFMTWNLLHTARMLKDAGGFPSHGNVAKEWDEDNKFGFENPEYR